MSFYTLNGHRRSYVVRRLRFAFPYARSVPFFFFGGGGAFAKLRTATVSVVMSVYPHGSHWTHCHPVWYVSIFGKYVVTIQTSLKYGKNNVHLLYVKTYVQLGFTRAPVFLQ